MAITVNMDDIYSVVENIHYLENSKDREIVSGYMQELRDSGSTPGKTVERALEWSERFLLQAHPDMGQVVTMRLASHYVSQIAKEIGVHAAQRRQEKITAE